MWIPIYCLWVGLRPSSVPLSKSILDSTCPLQCRSKSPLRLLPLLLFMYTSSNNLSLVWIFFLLQTSHRAFFFKIQGSLQSCTVPFLHCMVSHPSAKTTKYTQTVWRGRTIPVSSFFTSNYLVLVPIVFTLPRSSKRPTIAFYQLHDVPSFLVPVLSHVGFFWEH